LPCHQEEKSLRLNNVHDNLQEVIYRIIFIIDLSLGLFGG
jgi:hypothetical protein